MLCYEPSRVSLVIVYCFLVKYKGGCIVRVILFTHLVYFSKRWLKCYNFREIQGQESIFCQQNITKSDQVFIIICFLDARGDWTLSRECERVLIILYSIYAMSAWEFFGAYFCFAQQMLHAPVYEGLGVFLLTSTGFWIAGKRDYFQ